MSAPPPLKCYMVSQGCSHNRGCVDAAIWPASGVERPPQAAATRPRSGRHTTASAVAAAVVAVMHKRHYNGTKETSARV